MTEPDFIVVGAGFAGISAARELSQQGHAVEIIEARDRIGGRTWSTEWRGHTTELGGFCVHWLQASVWAEVTRYGLELKELPPAQQAHWQAADGTRITSDQTELDALLDRGLAPMCEEAQRLFPRPHDPFFAENEVVTLDSLSVEEGIDRHELDPEERVVLDAWLSSTLQAPCSEGAYTHALRWLALCGCDWRLCLDIVTRYKIVGGICTLAESMLEDAEANLRLSSPVVMVEDLDDCARLTLADGGTRDCERVIMTAPLHALRGIEFDPQLSLGKREAIEEGQTSHGLKVIAELAGDQEAYVAMAPGDNDITIIQYEESLGNAHRVVAFGPNSEAFDPNDQVAVQEHLAHLLPGIKVEASIGHDWVADPFSRQTWPVLKPNQLTHSLRHLQAPEHRIRLAGSDYASGWAGFIDGAISSGISVARNLLAHSGQYSRRPATRGDNQMVTNTESASFSPYFLDDGRTSGEVHWTHGDGSSDGLKSGIWRVGPGSYPDGETIDYTHHTAETMLILEGEVDIELDGGEHVHLGPNDTVHFDQGTTYKWSVKAPFKKFFVQD